MSGVDKRTAWLRGLVLISVGVALVTRALQPASVLARPPPVRIVSLNLCVDQILIDLVEKDRIAALSFLAADPNMSAVANRAMRYARVRGQAEAVLDLNPDLVIAGAYSTPATRSLLQRLGKRLEVVHQPTTIDGIRDLVKHLSLLVGAPERGRQMIADFDRRLHAAIEHQVSSSINPTALVLEVNNIVSMQSTLLDDALKFAGLKNAAGNMITARSGRVSLETLITSPPDVLIFANTPSDFKTVLADNLRHPVLQTLKKGRPVVTLPMWASLCGTPYIVTAIEQFATARRDAMAQRGAP